MFPPLGDPSHWSHDTLASIDIKAAVEARPFVVLRLHDVAGSHKSDGDYDSVWISGCKPCNSGFSWEKKRRLLALRTGSFRKNSECFLVDQNAGSTGQRHFRPLPVRLDLAGRTHDKSRHWIAEVPVFAR